MSWTYSGDPSSSPRDEIRFTLGDTTETKQSLTDGEITWLLAQAGGATAPAAIEAAHAMSARYSGLSATSKKVGDLSLSVDYGATASRFTALADRLTRAGRRGTMFLPTSGDSEPAAFSIGMDDYAD